MKSYSKQLLDFVHRTIGCKNENQLVPGKEPVYEYANNATIHRPHHHQRRRWWQRRFPPCPTTPDIPRRELPPPPVAPCFGYDMEGGAVHKSGGKGAAPARATHRRVINYYPVRRARDTLPSTSSPTAYAVALTLLPSPPFPRCSPAGGPESR